MHKYEINLHQLILGVVRPHSNAIQFLNCLLPRSFFFNYFYNQESFLSKLLVHSQKRHFLPLYFYFKSVPLTGWFFYTTGLNHEFHNLISSLEIRPLQLALVGEALYGIALLCKLLHPVCSHMCTALLDCPLLNYLSKSGSGPTPQWFCFIWLVGPFEVKVNWWRKVWWKGLEYIWPTVVDCWIVSLISWCDKLNNHFIHRLVILMPSLIDQLY